VPRAVTNEEGTRWRREVTGLQMHERTAKKNKARKKKGKFKGRARFHSRITREQGLNGPGNAERSQKKGKSERYAKGKRDGRKEDRPEIKNTWAVEREKKDEHVRGKRDLRSAVSLKCRAKPTFKGARRRQAPKAK